MKQSFLALYCVLAIVGAANEAVADCALSATDAERAQCIGADLRRSDAMINDEYSKLRGLLDPQGQAELKRQEVAWIRARATACQVDGRESDRERWFATLLQDYGKTVCVVRFTDRRVTELQTQTAALNRPKTGSLGAPAELPPLFTPDTGGDEVYDVVARDQPSSGKWYFEVKLDPSAIAQVSSATVFIGVHSGGFSNVGTLQTIRRRNIGQSSMSIGIALDLDDGKLFIRINGAWRAPPGSAGGLDLKLGRPYQARLSSSISLTHLLDSGQVDIDFGQHPFDYAIPDGYIAIDQKGPQRLIEPQ